MPNVSPVVAANMDALSDQYQIITENIAHASMTGYKRTVGNFAGALAAAQSGALALETHTDFSQGNLAATGRNLDLVLQGKGFFVINSQQSQGEIYTRNGVFNLNAQGQLVDCAGNIVAGQNGPITIPRTATLSSVSVAANGDVSAGGQKLGTLRIVEFESNNKLEAVGDCNYRATDGAQPKPSPRTTVHQGFEEASNVTLVQEMVNLIKVARMYEANAKTLTSQDDGASRCSASPPVSREKPCYAHFRRLPRA